MSDRMHTDSQKQYDHGERPYRSHLQPACVPCRRRKSRCQTDTGDSVCLMCRAHRTQCIYPNGSQSPKAVAAMTRAQARSSHRKGNNSRQKGIGELSQNPTTSASGANVGAPMYRTALPNASPTALFQPHGGGHRAAPVGRAQQNQGPAASNSMAESHHAHQHHHHHHHNNHRHHHNHNDGDDHDDEPSSIAFDSADDHQLNLHIVGPAVTNDSQVLADYLSGIPGATRATRMVVPVPASRRTRPVLFTRVQKRPLGVTANRSPSAEKLEMIEKLLEPYAADVIDLYFKKANICFPILDEVSFRRQYHENKDKISPALLACIYAHAMIYWDQMFPASHVRRPDSRFIWNLANTAVYSEIHLLPGMSIIKAIALNIAGRPTTSLIGNGVMLGSAVSMAYSLGLNHNPLGWEIPQQEKYLRMKIWWTILLHDRWASLAHGTPPHITPTHHDVPPPNLEYIFGGPGVVVNEAESQPASVFVALASLTDVLDMHLQYIYDFNKEKTPPRVANLELALSRWVESLTGAVRLIIMRGSHMDIPGASNLRLAYLTVKLLLQRIELEADKRILGASNSSGASGGGGSGGGSSGSTKSRRINPSASTVNHNNSNNNGGADDKGHGDRLRSRDLQARQTAEDILIMTQELTAEQLGDFWLSVSAFSYPAAVNFLLRCALETGTSPADLAATNGAFRIARGLIDALRSHRDGPNAWDLGDVCLAQHSEIVDKILLAAGAIPSSHGAGGPLDAGVSLDLHDFVMPDPSDIDQFFPDLWDPLQTAWM